MSACPNCGAIPGQSDRYCNTCGTLLVPQPVAAQQPPSPSPYGAPPAPVPPVYAGSPQAQWGGPTPMPLPTRCQLGHEIAPGQNYCAQGHPLALEGVQFAGSPQQHYAAPVASYGPQGYPGPSGQQPSAPYPSPYPGPPASPQPYPGPAQGYSGGPPPGYAGGGAYGQGYAPPPPQPIYVQSSSSPMPMAHDPAPVGSRVLRGFLVSFQSNPLGDFWPLYAGRTVIGRANSGETLDIPLGDATISSRHGAFTVDAASGSILLEDTGSTNGTFVNDEHLGFNGRRELRDGDRVRFGGYTTLVKVIART